MKNQLRFKTTDTDYGHDLWKGGFKGLNFSRVSESGIDKKVKAYDLPAHLPVRIRTQIRHAEAGLEKRNSSPQRALWTQRNKGRV